MTRGEGGALAIGGLLAIEAVVALVAGALGGSVEYVVQDGPPAPPPPTDGASGVVIAKHISGGFSVVGFALRSPIYDVHVSMVASPDCVWIDDGEELLHSTGECVDVPVVGPSSA